MTRTATPAGGSRSSVSGPHRVPGADWTYQAVSSTPTTFLAGSSGPCQGYADVTTASQDAGSGSYTVANVQSGTGGNQ